MHYKFQYSTPEERENIMQQNGDKFLIEEQNIFEGNFLIFSDAPTNPNTLLERIVALENNELIKEGLI